MIDADAVAEAEGEAILMYEEAGLDPSVAVSPTRLCKALHGRNPTRVKHLARPSLMGRLNGDVAIYLCAGVLEERARWLVCHELAHARLGVFTCGGAELVERRCDLLAACLVAPRPAFRAMLKKCGHGVYDLAHAFSTTHALAMLRLGEVTGRSVRLLGPRERVRGEEGFVWPDPAEALAGKWRATVHPIRLRDEGKWGLMAA